MIFYFLSFLEIKKKVFLKKTHVLILIQRRPLSATMSTLDVVGR